MERVYHGLALLYITLIIPVVTGAGITCSGVGLYRIPGGTSCGVCESGYMCPVGLEDKIPCPPGKYRFSRGTASCDDCQIDTYSSALGSSQCTPCAIGWSTPIGSNNCSETCSDTYYMSVSSGATSICIPMKICNSSEWWKAGGMDGNSDRTCAPLTPCDTSWLISELSCTEGGTKKMCRFRNNYVVRAIPRASNQICIPYAQCGIGHYMYSQYVADHSGVIIRPQLCKPYSQCGSNQYMLVNGSLFEDRDNICVDLTSCIDGKEYEIIEPSSNRVSNAHQAINVNKTCFTNTVLFTG